MYTISRVKNTHLDEIYNYQIRDNEKMMLLSFEGNLDFYMSAVSMKDHREKKICFTIDKSNYTLYSLFYELFEDITNCNVFTIDQQRLEFMEDDEERKEYIDRINRLNSDLHRFSPYNRLVKSNLITWKSDDRDYGEPDFVKIYKGEDAFYITFVRQSDFLHLGTSVRFRNSGSSYDPFNVCFMRFFNKLQDYDPDYHQIHIEEIEYAKKLTKTLN